MRWLWVGVACAMATAVQAGEPAPSIWQRLHGHWQGNGTVSGNSAELSLEFRPALDARGHHLRFANDMRGADDKVWRFRAEALYLCDAEARCRGHWYDSRGMVLPLGTHVEGDALIVDWGDAETERGRTTYRLDGMRRIDITDEVQGRDGVWKVFGKTRVKRRAGK